MCTIVAVRGVRSDMPLLLATNRDEFFARPSTGAVRLLDDPPTVGGRDLLAGGTWMGVTRTGFFVGVTNQRGSGGHDPARKSRGSLVMEALALSDVDAIARHLERVDAREYNAFNLMWGDANSLRVAYARDERALAQASVPEGVHVLPNDRLDSPDFLKVQRARTLLAPVLDAALPALIEGMKQMLADTELPSVEALPLRQGDPPWLRQLAALCVHTPAYGTRSSTVIALQPGRVAEYWVADGPPDRTPFIEVSPLFGA